MRNIQCPICSKKEIQVIRKFRGNHVAYLNMDLVSCISCGLVFADPMPSKELLDDYNASFFQINPNAGKPEDFFASVFYKAIARLRVSYVNDYINKNNIIVNKVLEVGPGPGFFVENWMLSKTNSKYYAIETDETCHKSLLQKGVKLLDNESIMNEENFDMIVMSHVLEHSNNPILFIKEFITKLKCGGMLFIEVPCRDWEHKNSEEPHLLFFDKNPMIQLLENLGFEMIQVGYFGEKIKNLNQKNNFRKKWKGLKHKLILNGLIWPFSIKRKGVEMINDPVERAVLSVFEANNIELTEPAWWLRAVAIKK